jgi:hypothetical protein
MSFDRAEYTAYENDLERKHQSGVDQDDAKERRMLYKKDWLLEALLSGDFDIFSVLEDELLCDNDAADKYQKAILSAIKDNPALYECFEKAALIKAEQLIERENKVNKVTGLFAQLSADAREHYDNYG